METIRNLINEEFSGTRALEHTEKITRYYRSPGSSGIQTVTKFCAEQLKSAGIDDIVIENFPMDGTAVFLGRKAYPAWEPKEVELRVIDPVDEEIVNYHNTPTCIMWFSTPTPIEGVVAEVVDVGSGGTVEDYEGKNVAGKIILASGKDVLNPGTRLYNLAIERFGAIGVVTDYLLGEIPGIRSRDSQPDFVGLQRQPRRWTKGWSIVISGTKGSRLRALLAKGPVKLWAKVCTIMTKDSQDTLIGSIKGTDLSHESVVIVAHTSGTKPGGNCATGPALLNESARVLRKLINEKKLVRPRRTIKFLYVYEGLGSNSYIEKRWNQRENMIGGICICGVGEDQEKCKSALTISRTPDSLPSFLNDFSAHLLKEISGRKLLHSGPMRINVDPYSPFSDNSTFNLSGIPCVLLSNKPIKYFHTQFMTADKMDPNVLKVSGMVTLETAYRIANAGLENAKEVANIVAENSEKRVGDRGIGSISELTKYREDNIDYTKKLKQMTFILERDIKAIDSTKRLVQNESEEYKTEFDAFVNGLKNNLYTKMQSEKNKIDSILLSIEGRN